MFMVGCLIIQYSLLIYLNLCSAEHATEGTEGSWAQIKI